MFWSAYLGGKKALRLRTTHISIKLASLNAIQRSYRYLIIAISLVSLLSDSKSTFRGYWYFIYRAAVDRNLRRKVTSAQFDATVPQW